MEAIGQFKYILYYHYLLITGIVEYIITNLFPHIFFFLLQVSVETHIILTRIMCMESMETVS